MPYVQYGCVVPSVAVKPHMFQPVGKKILYTVNRLSFIEAFLQCIKMDFPVIVNIHHSWLIQVNSATMFEIYSFIYLFPKGQGQNVPLWYDIHINSNQYRRENKENTVSTVTICHLIFKVLLRMPSFWRILWYCVLWHLMHSSSRLYKLILQFLTAGIELFWNNSLYDSRIKHYIMQT